MITTSIDSLQNQYDAAIEIVKGHNAVVPQEMQINTASFIVDIKLMGGTSPSRLSGLSWENILSCLGTSGSAIKPTALAKEIANVWRTEQKPLKPEQNRVSAKKADKMSMRELVEAYDPEEQDSPVLKRLKTLSQDRPFIVYNNNQIEIDTTVLFLNEIRKGYPHRNFHEVNGTVRKVFRAGDIPDNYVAENPCYPGRPLRPSDESCDQTNRSWSSIPLKTRQLVRVAINDGQIIIKNLQTVHEVLDMLLETNGYQKFAARYQASVLRFHELEKQNALPSLMVTLELKNSGKKGWNLADNPVKG